MSAETVIPGETLNLRNVESRDNCEHDEVLSKMLSFCDSPNNLEKFERSGGLAYVTISGELVYSDPNEPNPTAAEVAAFPTELIENPNDSRFYPKLRPIEFDYTDFVTYQLDEIEKRVRIAIGNPDDPNISPDESNKIKAKITHVIEEFFWNDFDDVIARHLRLTALVSPVNVRMGESDLKKMAEDGHPWARKLRASMNNDYTIRFTPKPSTDNHKEQAITDIKIQPKPTIDDSQIAA